MPSCLGTELFLQSVTLHYCYHLSFKCASQSWSLQLLFRVYVLPISLREPSQPSVSWFQSHSCLLQTVIAISLTQRRNRVNHGWLSSCSCSVYYSAMRKHRRGWRKRKSQQRTEHFLGFSIRCKVLSQGVTEMGSVRTCMWNVRYRLMCSSLGLQLGAILRGSGNFRKDGESRRLGAVPWQCLPPAPPIFA